jgi:hypothetical protein
MTKRCTKEIPDGCDNWKPGSSGLRCGWIDYCGICNLAELKKCEDCGGVPELKQSTGLIYYRYRCIGCGIQMPYRASEGEALAVWNSHEKTPPTRGELEAEVEQLERDLAEADEVIVENCRLCRRRGIARWDTTKDPCSVCPTIKQEAKAKARIEARKGKPK